MKRCYQSVVKATLQNAKPKTLTALRCSSVTRSYSNTSFSSDSVSSSDNFYKVTGLKTRDDGTVTAFAGNTETIHALSETVRGEVVDHAIDLTNVRPGDKIEVPYEVTISPSMRDFWQSAFYSHDRINTSTPFARSLGLQDQVLPFHLMLFLAGSMSHADQAKLQVGFSNARYHWPAFPNDTFKKQFIIQSLRSTSDKRHSIFIIECRLINQRGVVVFTCDKTMLFPFEVPQSEVVLAPSKESKKSDFLDHLIKQAQTLHEIGSQTLTSMRPQQLILHTLTRPISETHSMQLATLGRLTHERHFNTRLFRREELLVPGGLVLGLTCSLASRDLHEVCFTVLSHCIVVLLNLFGAVLGTFRRAYRV